MRPPRRVCALPLLGALGLLEECHRLDAMGVVFEVDLRAASQDSQRCAGCGRELTDAEVAGSDRAPTTRKGRVWCERCAATLDERRSAGGKS